jgi:hypothetical protein
MISLHISVAHEFSLVAAIKLIIALNMAVSEPPLWPSSNLWLLQWLDQTKCCCNTPPFDRVHLEINIFGKNRNNLSSDYSIMNLQGYEPARFKE